MDTNSINKASWNNHAERYQRNAKFSFDTVDYGIVNCLNESDLNLLGDVCGKKILELGCGGANCGIALAKQGAIVTCIDISEKQIMLAKENAASEKVNIEFIVSDIEEMNIGESKYDIVISMAALGYIENIEKVFQNVKFTLKDRGIFVCSLPDATNACVTSKYLWNDPPETHSYFYTGPTKWKWEDDDDFEFVTYRKPIGEYINILTDMGFYIRKVYQLPEKLEKIESEQDEFSILYPSINVIKAVNVNIPL
ncbi:MAG TPA: class I SAM-dependent methyltransferase [Mobilitalea sp.]|nr:class I SAM-dependent methyltransferase [Mobilitalea sp.]